MSTSVMSTNGIPDSTTLNMNAWMADPNFMRLARADSEPNIKNEPTKYTVTLLIPTDAIGLLIGKVGCCLIVASPAAL